MNEVDPACRFGGQAEVVRALGRIKALSFDLEDVHLPFASEDGVVVEDQALAAVLLHHREACAQSGEAAADRNNIICFAGVDRVLWQIRVTAMGDRKSTRLNSSH